jgi:hypothetical protein
VDVAAAGMKQFEVLPACSWWRRRLHRWRRRADERFILPAIKARAGEKFRAAQAFALFTGERGQEHWRCACSDTDYDRVMTDLVR